MREYIRRFFFAGMIGICIGFSFLGGSSSIAEAAPDSNYHREWVWPANGVISDTYGTRMGRHKGIDIAGDLHSPILAVDEGIVEKSYYSESYGNVIFVRHPTHYVTVYAHLSTRLAMEGQVVRRGQMIGRMGSSGQATGVHLHFEAHKSEWTYEKKFALDPERILGAKKLGEAVQAGAINRDIGALEASTRYHLQNENKISRERSNRKNLGDEYVVQQGDTLSSISLKYHLGLEEIKRKNHLSSDLIQPGQKLVIR